MAKGTVCDVKVLEEQRKCSSNNVLVRQRFAACSGWDDTCVVSGAVQAWSPWTVAESCGNGAVCNAVAGTPTCAAAAPCTSASHCDDGNACTVDACDEGLGCTNKAKDAGPCGTGAGCQPEGKCDSGQCTLPPANCNDFNPCTADECSVDGQGCVFLPTSQDLPIISLNNEPERTIQTSKNQTNRVSGLSRTMRLCRFLVVWA